MRGAGQNQKRLSSMPCAWSWCRRLSLLIDETVVREEQAP